MGYWRRLDMLDEWTRKPLAELATYTNGRAFKPSDWTEAGLPIIRIAQLTRADAQPNHFAGSVDEKHMVRAGDLLFSWSATLTTRIWDGSPAVLNQHIFKVQEKQGVDRGFLAHLIEWSIPALALRSHGSTMKHIRKGVLSEFQVPVPPLPEQRKIAEILGSVDEAIQATQAVIDQTRRVKQGLLQELFTRGIGHTRFKQTEIGEIPESWEVCLLDQVATRGSGHTPSKRYPEYWDGGVKWVSLKDSSRLDELYISDTVSKISQLGIENSSAVEHPAGVVVLSRDAGVGKSAITTERMAVSQHFMAWDCGPKLVNYFLYYLLQLWKPKFERIATGSTIKTIGLSYFKALRVPVPPVEEQLRISQALKSSDMSIFSYRDVAKSLQRVKSGLLSDLLSGKVRVKF